MRFPLLQAFAIALTATAVGGHPLDPLTAEEIDAVRTTLDAAGHLNDDTRFISVSLVEPSKDVVMGWTGGSETSTRRAEALIHSMEGNVTWRAIVDVAEGEVEEWTLLEGVHPAIMDLDAEIAEEVVRESEVWIAAMALRGIEGDDLEKVKPDVWAAGMRFDGETETPDRARLVRVIFFYGDNEEANHYSRPIEGLSAVVDVAARRLIRLMDSGVVRVAPGSDDFGDGTIEPRPALAPLVTSLPEGPGYSRDGWSLRWDRWDVRFGFTQREGLVLHQVRYDDEGRLRPILYRAALSEMLVPYGDPSETWIWRNAFDVGEYSLGYCASTMVRGADVPAHAELLPAVVTAEDGTPYEMEDVIAIYERDGGLLWRHDDYTRGRVHARRGRELVLRFTAVVGNYDYALSWIFSQDGSIRYEAELTGIILAKGTEEETCPGCREWTTTGTITPSPENADRYGRLVAPQIVGVNHQHFFNVRMDFTVDGVTNSVAEYNVTRERDRVRNPTGNAFYNEVTLFGTEWEARRNVDEARHRRWKVYNPSETTSLGHNPGYILVPGQNALPFLAPDADVRRRASFLENHFWVTRFKPTELFAAGEFPNLGPKGGGLEQFTLDNESIQGTDIVVWYGFGVTHVPHPEEWPVMPVSRAGFRLMPSGFFDRNPALDVP